MNTGQTWQITSSSLEDTLSLGEVIGRRLRGGEVIELISDLGGGKTSFVKGLAKGMNSPDLVHSPSFTVSNQYQSSGLTMYHFDFHRLDEPGIIGAELAEILNDNQAVVVIEWPGLVEAALPSQRLSITISVNGPDSRQFNIQCPKPLAYLLDIT